MKLTTVMTALPLILLFSGCQFGLNPETSSVEDEALDIADIFGASFSQQPVTEEMESELGGASFGALATAPTGATVVAYDLPPSGSTTYEEVEDYPEFGWDTTATIAVTDTSNVYKVTSLSVPRDTYDRYLVEDQVEEVYYIEDTTHSDGSAGADGEYNYHDPIYDPSSGTWDSLYRERLAVTFDDESVRNEILVESSNAGGRTFELFPTDIDSADMTFPEAGYQPDGIAANANTFSSVVLYTQQLDQDLNFWYNDSAVTPYLVGVRYYSELHDIIRGTYIATTYILEVVMDGDASAPDLDTDTVLANIVTRKATTIDDSTFAATRHEARMLIVVPDPGGNGTIEVRGNSKKYNEKTKDVTRQRETRQLNKLVGSVLPPNFDNWTDVEAVFGGEVLTTGPLTVSE